MALRFHPEARAELDSVRRRYRVVDVDTARRFAAAMLDILERIEKTPSQFPEHGLLAVDTPLRPRRVGHPFTTDVYLLAWDPRKADTEMSRT
jgi:hypothetical protein